MTPDQKDKQDRKELRGSTAHTSRKGKRPAYVEALVKEAYLRGQQDGVLSLPPLARRPRLLPVCPEREGGWTDRLSEQVMDVLFEAKKTKYLDTGAAHLSTKILVLVQEALDAQGPGIQGGRKELWMDNAYAILQMIRERRGLLDRSLPDIDHMFKMIERPPTASKEEE